MEDIIPESIDVNEKASVKLQTKSLRDLVQNKYLPPTNEKVNNVDEFYLPNLGYFQNNSVEIDEEIEKELPNLSQSLYGLEELNDVMGISAPSMSYQKMSSTVSSQSATLPMNGQQPMNSSPNLSNHANDIILKVNQKVSTDLQDKTELTELKMNIVWLSNQNNQLLKEIDQLKSNETNHHAKLIQNYEDKLEKLKSELLKANEIIIQLQSTASQKSKLKSEDENNLEIMQKELKKILKEKEELEIRIENNVNQSVDMKFEMGNLRTEINKLKMELSRNKNDLEKIGNENKELKNELFKKEQDMNVYEVTMEQRVQSFILENQKLEEQMGKTCNELNDRIQLQAKSSHDIMNLERTIQSLTSENQSLSQRLHQLDETERELHHYKWKCSDLETKWNQAINELNHLRSNPRSVSSSYHRNETVSNGYPSYPSDSNYPPTHYGRPSLPLPPPPPPSSNPSSIPYDSSAARYPSSMNKESNSMQSNRSNLPDKSRSNQTSLSSLVRPNAKPYPSYQNVEVIPPSSIPPSYPDNSLANVLNRKGQDRRSDPGSGVGSSPFATEKSAAELSQEYSNIDQQLTMYMTEKSSLQEENERINQKGSKTLRERSKLQQNEVRLIEISREISQLRKILSGKPS